MQTVLRTFRWAFLMTLVGLAAAYFINGTAGLAIVAMLSVLEISFSFDNAVMNATILKRMNPFWQKMFLSIGIIIAVFGMRLLFPVIIVALTAHLNPSVVVNLALHQNNTSGGMTYAQHLTAAHPAIAAFGGMFLFMIFLDFILEDREIQWLRPVEKVLAKVGKLDQLSVVVALAGLLFATMFLVSGPERMTVLVSGVLGLVSYLAVNGLSSVFEEKNEETEEVTDELKKSGNIQVALAMGKQAFFLFLYLEVLDASFSFDGVIGAFAISQNVWVIALGLGIGAMYIRSLTVYLVRKGTLDDYVYLEHGAHYAIGALAVMLFLTIKFNIPEAVTGLTGVVLILAAFVSSVVRNKRAKAENPGVETNVGEPTLELASEEA